MKLAVAKVRTDGGTQARVRLDEDTVCSYVEALGRGAKFPPIIVFREASAHWCADGFHRLEATRRAGHKSIACEVRRGTRRDAILFAVGANDAHGLRRTNADKRRAVATLLGDPEWSAKSDRWIADACRVDGKTVARERAERTAELPQLPKPRTGKDGKARALPKGKAKPARPPLTRAAVPDVEREPSPPASDDFDPHDAVHRLACLFSEVLQGWPRHESLAPLVEWLRTKSGMMKVEAARWNKSA